MPDVIQIAIQAIDNASQVIGGVGTSLDKLGASADNAEKKMRLFGLSTEQIACNQWVLRESYLQMNEDLKEYAEKVKPGEEINRPSGNGKIPDLSRIGTVAGEDDGFIITEAGKLLESDHEKSKNLLKNIPNKLAISEKSAKTKLSDKQAETSRKKLLSLWVSCLSLDSSVWRSWLLRGYEMPNLPMKFHRDQTNRVTTHRHL